MKYLALVLLSSVFLVVDAGNGYSQTNPPQTGTRSGSLQSGTIDSQFIYLNRISRNHEGFKLIRPANLAIIRQNVADSLTAWRNQIYETEQQLSVLRRELSEQRDTLRQAQQEVARVNKEIDYINFLGIDFKKSTYHLIVWTLIIVLVLILMVSAIRFQRGNAQAREARATLEEVQTELERHRKKALEREQKLKRQLQDEINKRNG